MENNIGENLYKLRHEKGISQEELADILEVSRQAVSKWERNEALPDTANLIKLSELYGVTIDLIIHPAESDQDSEMPDIVPAEDTAEDGDKLHENAEEKSDEALHAFNKSVPILAVIAFFLWGFLGKAWYVSWTVFLLVPIWYSVGSCIRRKAVTPFAYPVLVSYIYLTIGMMYGMWHPFWILFLTIPVFYPVAEAIDQCVHKKS